MPPRRRGSASSHCSLIQSLWARANSAARYGLATSDVDPLVAVQYTDVHLERVEHVANDLGDGRARWLRFLVIQVLAEERGRVIPGISGEPERSALGRNQSRCAGSM